MVSGGLALEGRRALAPVEDVGTRPSAVPKLAIWHLLLWMACVCVVAAWNGAAIGAAQGSWPLKLQQMAAALTYYVISGLALAGLALAIGCVLGRRGYYPVSAGHWLLTTGGLIFLLSEASNRITDLWHQSSGGNDQVDYARHVGMYAYALMAAVQLVGAWLVKDSWPWRFVFMGYAMTGLFWSITGAIWTFGDRNTAYQLVDFGARFQWPWQWVMCVAVVSLTGLDLYRRRFRDWLHWTGIGYVAAWVISESLVILMHRLVTR